MTSTTNLASPNNSKHKNSGVAYALAAAIFFGIGGLHRFYLGRYLSGLIYLLTGDLLGIGLIIDLFGIPSMVQIENLKYGAVGGNNAVANANVVINMGEVMSQMPSQSQTPPTAIAQAEVNSEQKVLQAAQECPNCTATVGTLLLKTGLTRSALQEVLADFERDGLCHVDTDLDSGAVHYKFMLQPQLPS